MGKCLKDRNLSNCGRRDSLILMVKPNFFECYYLVSFFVSSLINNSVCSLTYLVDPLILVLFGVVAVCDIRVAYIIVRKIVVSITIVVAAFVLTGIIVNVKVHLYTSFCCKG
jgi:hypothetical protein